MKARSGSEVIVVGAGVVGAAAARALARGGASVTVLERGRIGAPAGSSRGTSRIVAPAGYPDASYLDDALTALAGWRELERECGEALLTFDGALYAGADTEELARGFAAAGVSFTLLEPADVERRFGVFDLGPGPVGYQHEAGVIRADRAVAALLASARRHGARLCEGVEVTAIVPNDDGVTIDSSAGRLRCERALLTAGPWTPSLLAPTGTDLGLEPSSQAVVYFRPPPGSDRLPAVMEFESGGEEPYALIDPVRGLKVALHRRGPAADPDIPWKVVDDTAAEHAAAWAKDRFPGLGEPIDVEACMYTNAPGERFVCERHGTLVVGSACSGQGFQFAPVTGLRLAALAAEE